MSAPIPDTGAITATLAAPEAEAAARPPRWRRAGRRLLLALVVVLSCLMITTGVVGLWARRNFLDTDRFVQRVGPVVEEPVVKDALTERLTQQLMELVNPRAFFLEVLPERGALLAGPLTRALEDFARDRVAEFVASDRFEELWVRALTSAHEEVVAVLRDESEVLAVDGGEVVIDLLPIINAILDRLTADAPGILGDVEVPDLAGGAVGRVAVERLEEALGVELGAGFGTITIYDEGKVEAAQRAIEIFDRLALVLLPGGLLLAGLAIGFSARRRRTLLQVLFGVALAMVVLRRVGFRLETEIAALPPNPGGQQSAAEVLGAFLDPLLTFALWTLVAIAVVAAIALVTGSYPWAVRLRRWTRSSVERLADHRDVLVVAVPAVAFLLFAAVDLSWFGMLAVLAVAGALELALLRPDEQPPTSTSA